MRGTLTTPVNTAQDVIAYWIVSPVSDEIARLIGGLQISLAERFSDAIWNVPRDSLHISFNALSPIFEADKIINPPSDIPAAYIDAFEKTVRAQKPIRLHFDTIEAFPAAIILKAQDDGAYKRLRDQFNECVELPVGTKPTPAIIHTTICKFHQSISLDEVEDFLATKTLEVDMLVEEFRIVREKMLYMVNFDILRQFKLRDSI
jgi:2'-5' RNA ligase